MMAREALVHNNSSNPSLVHVSIPEQLIPSLRFLGFILLGE